MKYRFFILIVLSIFISCKQSDGELDAQEVVNRAIEIAGGENYERASIKFDFRNSTYRSSRNNGEFELERLVVDSAGFKTRDVLTNNGLVRFRNDSAVKIADSLMNSVSNSVNSVHYFVQLPYGLNAPAANKELVGRDTINSQGYYEIKVTFNAEAGGSDHEDVYLYWINDNTFTVDYLAYNFEVNEGGVRFRKAINPRVINGIRFVDYENFKYPDADVKLEKLDSLYTAGELDYISKIVNRNIEVELRE
ncbi:DUF6503 family protein [Autumnicola psychrophila]|uniref:DUF6503 family protein n=1 Tax=Autumnicola psychrophila TaxID=3075592 RepID=A0ABU3DTS6_9FLAO|nr:DUF6503 family protein [Zunongwangia sp. F225]MDT0687100.1 DUF6503 family protein [Zunongwangia sp. F225]